MVRLRTSMYWILKFTIDPMEYKAHGLEPFKNRIVITDWWFEYPMEVSMGILMSWEYPIYIYMW